MSQVWHVPWRLCVRCHRFGMWCVRCHRFGMCHGVCASDVMASVRQMSCHVMLKLPLPYLQCSARQCSAVKAVSRLTHLLLPLVKLCPLEDHISACYKVSIQLHLNCVVLTRFLLGWGAGKPVYPPPPPPLCKSVHSLDFRPLASPIQMRCGICRSV